MGKDINGNELGKGLSQSSDGMYLARTTHNGVRKQKSFKTINSAERWINSLKNGNSTLVKRPATTVGEWFDKWMSVYKFGKVKESSIETYTYHYLRYIDIIIGRNPINDVTSIDCQTVLNNATTITKSLKSIAQVRTIMYGMFDCAMNNGLISRNPVTTLVKVPRLDKAKQRVLTRREQELFLETSKKYMYREQLILMLNTGMRAGEVAGLMWRDVDFDKRMIHVRQILTRVNGTLQVSTPKTEHSVRCIPMTSAVVDTLKSLDHRSDYVFVNKWNRPIERNCYNNIIYKICDEAGIERCSCHTLRHTFATRCIENGMKPKILQKILGHSSINITMDLYVHATEDEMAREMAEIGNIAT